MDTQNVYEQGYRPCEIVTLVKVSMVVAVLSVLIPQCYITVHGLMERQHSWGDTSWHDLIPDRFLIKVKHHGSIHCPSFQLGATSLFVGHIYNLLVFIFLDVSIWTHISIDMTPCKLTENITPNHMMCTIGWIHNGSKDVFWFKHFTPSHLKSIVFACIRPSLHLSVCLSVRITMFSARYNWKYVSNVFESLLEYFCSEFRGEFVVYLNIIEVLKCELQKWRYPPFPCYPTSETWMQYIQ